MRRRSRYQKIVTTILVIPMTLGTVLIAEGMLTYLGPKGCCHRRFSSCIWPASGPIDAQLLGRFLLSLIVSGFPFVFLLMLSYVSGIDPVLGRAAATLGASPWRQFRHNLPAAPAPWSGDGVLPGVRAGVLGVPIATGPR